MCECFSSYEKILAFKEMLEKHYTKFEVKLLIEKLTAEIKDDRIGIVNITEENHDDFSKITYTLSNGTKKTITVKNGEKGDTGPLGPEGKQGEPGPEGKKGINGISCKHSWDGTVLTVTSASGTSSVDLKGAKGDTGDKGKDGYTPIKGIDYFDGKTGPQGLEGKKGDPFTYDDFTTELIEDLKKPAYDGAKIATDKAIELNDTIIENTAKVDNAVLTANNASAVAYDASVYAQSANEYASTAHTKADQAIDIAKGRATGYVFDTVEDMQDWLKDTKNISELVLGDNLYIKATNVPDYWWDGEKAQELETLKVDLSECVKNTDYAGNSKAGIVKVSSTYGTGITLNNIVYIYKATESDIDAKTHNCRPIVPNSLDYAVKVGVTTNTITLTDVEQANAKKWLGLSPITFDEYEALTDKSGINFVYPIDYVKE